MKYPDGEEGSGKLRPGEKNQLLLGLTRQPTAGEPERLKEWRSVGGLERPPGLAQPGGERRLRAPATDAERVQALQGASEAWAQVARGSQRQPATRRMEREMASDAIALLLFPPIAGFQSRRRR